jgi:hypothetical protein
VGSTGVREYAEREDTNASPPFGSLADELRDVPKKRKAFGLYAGRVALDSMCAAPTTSISELPGIHDSAKHERGGAPYFVSAQNPL